MVGPPSSWSLRDQEDAGCQARFAERPHVGPFTPLGSMLPVLAPEGPADASKAHADALPADPLHRFHPAGNHECRLSRRTARVAADRLPRGWLRSGGEMLFKSAFVLLIAWLLGVLGLYRIGDIVHMFLLVGGMLLLLATARARDAAARERVRRDP
jgi:hypothetical protein